MHQEEALIAAGRGKWSSPGVPHKGWHCVDIEDLGEPSLTCEMCESQSVRYVHHMEHPTYSGTLQTGCVCAGHMEGNLQASRMREASMKSRSAKRKRWVSRAWKISSKGNPHIKSDGYRVTIYPRGNGWACTVAKDDNSLVQHSRRNFIGMDEAKLAAFDHITRLIASNRKG